MNPARFSLSHSPLIGWGLAVAAIAIGYMQYGWPGVFLAFTVIVFWLLLQFSRALRVMRAAATNPVASVDSALMAQTRIHPGMKMLQVLRETRSLGQRLPHPSPGRATPSSRGPRGPADGVGNGVGGRPGHATGAPVARLTD
ncbi:MAG: hypothetical protein EBR46_05775 [Betaproteobacteria bacterium]|nr:hypothetical protein [Betaproteobacteria bacterium]